MRPPSTTRTRARATRERRGTRRTRAPRESAGLVRVVVLRLASRAGHGHGAERDARRRRRRRRRGTLLPRDGGGVARASGRARLPRRGDAAAERERGRDRGHRRRGSGEGGSERDRVRGGATTRGAASMRRMECADDDAFFGDHSTSEQRNATQRRDPQIRAATHCSPRADGDHGANVDPPPAPSSGDVESATPAWASKACGRSSSPRVDA